ncbi:MAG TPA: hypothetical protein VFO10_03955 [Oligoflexus sp.]|uniref:hypothetical protein n=1 Tax=Oligoflexus sp. TaxID=1971216 RepID=UPI002D7FAD0B|nr:hypothetical protein [Oligoflexus sp.]HET9236373.1 hypothetical protein [Oligoflexus sp.]
MHSAPLTRILATIWLLSAADLRAVSKPQPLTEAAGEVITWIESVDPSTQTQKEVWDKIRKALETAGREAESEAGLKLSVSSILEHWNGKSFRILDEADPQSWALSSQDQAFPDLGAAWKARGNKWTVQYVGRHGQKLFRRGDAVKTVGFHPIQSARTQKLSLEVQNNPMSAPRKLELNVRPQPFADYVLAETQAAGTMMTQEKNRICLQKAWFWMNDAVNAHLLSRVSFQTANCTAQLIDLRDAFGLEPTGPLKISKKIPTVVLINHDTREGAARFALRLKKELNARIIGEPTGQTVLPEKLQTLKSLPWTVIAYAGTGAPVEPDAVVKDSLVYADGLDAAFEEGLRWIRGELGLR